MSALQWLRGDWPFAAFVFAITLALAALALALAPTDDRNAAPRGVRGTLYDDGRFVPDVTP